MKTKLLFKTICTAIVVAGLLFSTFTADAVSLKHNWSKQQEVIHKALEERGFTHIADLSIVKSDVHKTKFFVNFMNEGKVYDAYFTKKGELVELYKVAE